jgi:hypothetical protein
MARAPRLAHDGVLDRLLALGQGIGEALQRRCPRGGRQAAPYAAIIGPARRLYRRFDLAKRETGETSDFILSGGALDNMRLASAGHANAIDEACLHGLSSLFLPMRIYIHVF